jgi:hypothetical protein
MGRRAAPADQPPEHLDDAARPARGLTGGRAQPLAQVDDLIDHSRFDRRQGRRLGQPRRIRGYKPALRTLLSVQPGVSH